MQNNLFKKSQSLTIIFLFFTVGLFPLTLGLNTTVSFEIEGGNLSGYVTDQLDNPIEGALIRVHFHGTYEEDYSDENGYYHVTNIPICYCMKNATCSKQGYKTEWVLLAITENTTYDFVLYPSEVYPVLNGSQCNGWWNGPVTVTFVYDPEEVAEIWYCYYGWHLYTEPFVVDENGTVGIDIDWIDFEGQHHYPTLMFDMDQQPLTTDLIYEVYRKIPFGKWYVKMTLVATDSISGMSPYLEFYINDVLMGEFEVFWPEFEIELEITDFTKNSKFGFYCYDNACNLAIEELDGSDITPHSRNLYGFKFLRILEHFPIFQRFIEII